MVAIFSGAIPAPVSLTEICTSLLSGPVRAQLTLIWPLAGVNLMAFPIRFDKTCTTRLRSQSTLSHPASGFCDQGYFLGRGISLEIPDNFPNDFTNVMLLVVED